MSLHRPSSSHDSGTKLRTNILNSNQNETRRAQHESADENNHESHPAQSKTAIAKESQHVAFEGAPMVNSATQYADTGSTYYSARSQFSFRSIFTRSTGQRSQNGATWRQALTKTMNSGFGSGTRVREGREKGGYLPPITGVGRTGKAPAPIPSSMLRALGVKSAAQSDGSPVSPPTSEGQELEQLPRRGFHNMSLEDLRLRDGTAVPIVVTQLIEAVELYGLETKGIYLGLYIGRDKVGDLGSPNEILKNNGTSIHRP